MIKFYVLGVMLLMFVGSACNNTQGVLLTGFISHYNLESAMQGLSSTSQSVGNLSALILVVFLMGRIRKVNIIIVGAFLIPPILFLLAQKPAFPVFLFSYLVYGAAFGLFDSLISSIMVDIYKEKASKSMNLLLGVYGAGGIIGPLLLQYLINSGLAWNNTLFVLCILSVFTAFLYAFAAFPIIKNRNLVPENTNKVTFSDMPNYIKDKKMKILLLCAVFYGSHQVGLIVWMPRYISEYLDAPAFGAGALSLYWVGATSSRLIISRLNLKPEKVILFGNLLSGLAVVIGVISGNGFIMMICCGLAGFFEGAILPMTLYLACYWISHNTAMGSSMVLFVSCTGFIVTPPLIGAMISWLGVTGGMIIPGIFSFIAFGCALSPAFLTRA